MRGRRCTHAYAAAVALTRVGRWLAEAGAGTLLVAPRLCARLNQAAGVSTYYRSQQVRGRWTDTCAVALVLVHVDRRLAWVVDVAFLDISLSSARLDTPACVSTCWGVRRVHTRNTDACAAVLALALALARLGIRLAGAGARTLHVARSSTPVKDQYVRAH